MALSSAAMYTPGNAVALVYDQLPVRVLATITTREMALQKHLYMSIQMFVIQTVDKSKNDKVD